jgi:hypothetical protein
MKTKNLPLTIFKGNRSLVALLFASVMLFAWAPKAQADCTISDVNATDFLSNYGTCEGVLIIPAGVTLTMNANLTIPSTIHTIHIEDGGRIYWTSNVTLTLAPNTAIVIANTSITTGVKALDAGVCNNNKRINIGSSAYAACVGGGNVCIIFEDLIEAGGTINPDIDIEIGGAVGNAACFDTFSLNVEVSGFVQGGVESLIYSWTQVSGPGTSVFVPSAGVKTPEVTVSVPGTYEYKVEVTDAGSGNCPDVTVNTSIEVEVLPPPTVSVSGTTTVEMGDPEPDVTFTNPNSFAVTAYYTINGGSELSVNIAANSFTNVSAPTNLPGDFVYSLTSGEYQVDPACPYDLIGTVTITVEGWLDIECPDPKVIDACSSEQDIEDAFDLWIAGFSYTGGVGNISETDLDAYSAPDICGGTTTIIYEVSDAYGQYATCSSTFTVAASEAIVLDPAPVDPELEACTSYEDIVEAYDAWVAGFDFQGGCGAEDNIADVPELPSDVTCEGADLEFTYIVSDACGTQSLTATFTVAASEAIVLDPAPVDPELEACTSYEDIVEAYDAWVAGFDFQGGCGAEDNIADVPELPSDVTCEGADLEFTYIVSDACGTQSLTATFTVAASEAIVLDPAPVDPELEACTSYEDIVEAYDAWVAGFDFQGGCGAEDNIADVPELPSDVACEGVYFEFTYIVSDACGTQSLTATFTVAASEAIVLDPAPVDPELEACTSYEDIVEAYDAWVAGFDFQGGCGAEDNIADVPELPSDVTCEGADLEFTYIVSDACGTQSLTATFTVAASEAIVLDPAPVDPELEACTSYEDIVEAYDAWVAGFDFQGGCGAEDNIADVPELPSDVTCEGADLEFTYIVSDACGTQSLTATFTVAASEAIVLDPAPVDPELEACTSYEDIVEAYDAWVAGFDFQGGCGAEDNIADVPELPSDVACEGVYFEFTYIVSDACGTQSLTATFTVNPQTVLEGTVSYYLATEPNVPLEGIEVKAVLGNNDPVKNGDHTVYTDASGNYKFEGDWVKDIIGVEISTALPHGGLSAIDALAVQIRGLGTDPRTVASYWDEGNDELVKHTGYVSQGIDLGIVGGLNPGEESGLSRNIGVFDALFILSRHVYPISTPYLSFWAADWAFYAVAQQNNTPAKNAHLHVIPFDAIDDDTGYLEYTTDCNTLDIEVRALGDVRGTYLTQMNQAKNLDATAKSIQKGDVIHVSREEVFEMPLKVMNKMEFSALDIELLYDNRKVEVIDVLSDNEDLIFAIHEDRIHMVWADVYPITIERGDAVATLVVRTIDTVGPEDELFRQSGRSEFGNSGAEALTWFELAISSVDNTILGLDDKPGVPEFSFSAYPNPFRGQLNLTYELEAPADVRITILNTMGAVVGEVINEPHGAGRYQRVFNANESQFKQGIYFVRVDVSGQASSYSEMIRLVYIK